MLNPMKPQRQWFDEVRGSLSLRAVARRVGMNHGNLSSYLTNDGLSSDQIIRICAALHADPIQALIDTGKITIRPDHHTINTQELADRIQHDIDELRRRATAQTFDEDHPTDYTPNGDDLLQSNYGLVAYDHDEDTERGWTHEE